MKLALAALAILPAGAFSDTNPKYSYSAIYDLSAKEVLPVVAAHVGTKRSILGIKGFDLDEIGFVGTTSKSTGAATYGIALVHGFAFPLRTRLDIGGFVRSQAGERMHGGLFIGIRAGS